MPKIQNLTNRSVLKPDYIPPVVKVYEGRTIIIWYEYNAGVKKRHRKYVRNLGDKIPVQ